MNYLTQQEYEKIADRILHSSYPNSYQMIINDSEKFGTIVNAVMTADWKYDESRVSEYQGNASLYGYRKQRVFWSINKIYSNKTKNKETVIEDIYEQRAINEIPESGTAFDIVEHNDEMEKLCASIEVSKVLSPQEKKYLKLLFLNNKSIDDIAEMFTIDKRALRNNINNGLKKLGAHNGYIRRLLEIQEGRRKYQRKNRKSRVQMQSQ
jgi:predicted DNA-binding protein YlxM (UPF0122 family)